MAIYHLTTKPISRSSGQSAVACSAYRSGERITDERIGKTFDYGSKRGILHTQIFTPDGVGDIDRSELWNLAEKTEKRSNSRTAREIIVNIPHELMQEDITAGQNLMTEFVEELVRRYGVAIDMAIHAPNSQGDDRNFHAHLMLTTRKAKLDQGKLHLGDKSQLELSNTQLEKLNLPKAKDEIVSIRELWAEKANKHLQANNIQSRIDHRSNADRDLDGSPLPTIKLGYKATALERKGIKTDKGDYNRAVKKYNALNLKHHEQQQAEREAEAERIWQEIRWDGGVYASQLRDIEQHEKQKAEKAEEDRKFAEENAEAIERYLEEQEREALEQQQAEREAEAEEARKQSHQTPTPRPRHAHAYNSIKSLMP